jgi:hypothetical protein
MLAFLGVLITAPAMLIIAAVVKLQDRLLVWLISRGSRRLTHDAFNAST